MSEQRFDKPALLLIIIYPLLFIWQGLDFTDTGYVLANYQSIFSDPQSVGASFKIWFSNILGGIWVYLFGDTLGLTGYRFAAVLLVYATLYLTYLTLKPYISRTHLLWGLFLAVVFINRSGYQLNYNSFTAFFYVLAAYLLIRGLQEEKRYLLFLSAFTLGLNTFVRLPNIIGFVLVLCIFFHGRLKSTSWRVQLRQAFIFLAGYITAILVVLLLMYLLGHLDLYLRAFMDTFTMLEDPTGHHRSDKLINTFLYHHQNMFFQIAAIFFSLLILAITLTNTAKLGSRVLQYGLILASAALFVHFYYDECQDWVNMLIVNLGLLYSILTIMTLRKESPPETHQGLRLTALVALIVLFIAPQGSNVAIRNSIYGMYLAIPLAFACLLNIREMNVFVRQSAKEALTGYRFRLSVGETKVIKATAIIMFLFFTIQSAYFFTYRDASNRMEMAYPVEHDRLKGVFTTKERAAVVQELLQELPRHVDEGEYLLAYEQTSLVYFLTNTRPYLYSAWPMLYSPARFERALNTAGKERSKLPLIVRAKGNTEDFNWPKTKNKLIKGGYYDKNRAIMEDFIRRKQYSIAWQNGFFEILVPPS